MKFCIEENNFPKKIIVGAGSLLNNGLCLEKKKALVIVDEFLLSSDSIKKFIKFFKEVSIYTEIKREPTSDDVAQVLKFMGDNRYDIVVGIGGGSVLDVSKLVASLYGNNICLQKAFGKNTIAKRYIELLMVPTTSGTGSEATPNSIIIDSTDNVKKAVIGNVLIPDIVILDAELTVTLPPSLTASTGIDAFCHCLESLISKNATPISESYSYQGIRLIGKYLKRAIETPDDVEAREKILLGSFLGGAALTLAGTTAVHALAYPLGKRGVPHGVANSVLLPWVLEHNLASCEEKLESIIPYLENDKLKCAKDVVEYIKKYLVDIPVPRDMEKYGITLACLEELSSEAMDQTRLLNNNPCDVNKEDAAKIYGHIL